MKRSRKIILLVLSIALLTVAVGAIQAVRIDRRADLWARTGQGAIKLLKELAAGIETGVATGEFQRALACFEEGEGWIVPEAILHDERDGIRVYSWVAGSEKGIGRDGVHVALRGILEGVDSLESSKLKLTALEGIAADGGAEIQAVLWLRGLWHDGNLFESKIRFAMRIVETEEAWSIAEQNLLDGRTVVGDGQGYSDVTEQAGIDFASRRNPDWDAEPWLPERFEIIKYSKGGVAVADYDGDGWQDLFFVDGTSSRIYHNDGDGTFTDLTLETGLPEQTIGASCAIFLDLDNDGDRDLFVGYFTHENRLYRNEGDGTFVDVTEGSGIGGFFVTTLTAADYDGDGLVDLYFGRYLDPRTELPTTLFYTRNGEGNTLLHNEGGLRFRDITEEAGVREGGLTLGLASADIDGDLDQDIYVANDFGRNALLRNDGDGTFTDVTLESGTMDYGFGMSASFGDIDSDGDLDLYTSNVHSGQRWYGQAATLHHYLVTSFKQGTLLDDYPLYREIQSQMGADWHSYGDRMVKGNSLFVNDGSGHFEDVSETAGANPFGWFWSSSMLDYDHDGRLDIYATNGWISGPETDDL